MVTQETIMGLIVHGGNARSLAMKALKKVRKLEFFEAEKLLKESSQELSQAHQVQTGLIQSEARGEKTELSLLMIHAQDHLMNAMTVRDLAEEMIQITKKYHENKGEL